MSVCLAIRVHLSWLFGYDPQEIFIYIDPITELTVGLFHVCAVMSHLLQNQ